MISSERCCPRPTQLREAPREPALGVARSVLAEQFALDEMLRYEHACADVSERSGPAARIDTLFPSLWKDAPPLGSLSMAPIHQNRSQRRDLDPKVEPDPEEGEHRHSSCIVFPREDASARLVPQRNSNLFITGPDQRGRGPKTGNQLREGTAR